MGWVLVTGHCIHDQSYDEVQQVHLGILMHMGHGEHDMEGWFVWCHNALKFNKCIWVFLCRLDMVSNDLHDLVRLSVKGWNYGRNQ